MWGYMALVGNLFRRHSVGNRGAAGKRVIAVGRLPVPGDDELGAIEELGSSQEGFGKVGAVKHRLEQVRALQMRTRQIRPAQVHPSEVGIPKIGPRKIEPAQIEPPQSGPRQVWRVVVFRPPVIPHCGAAAEYCDMLIVRLLPPLSSLRGALFHHCSELSDLILRQAFHAVQVGIRQVRPVELCQA
jgi:hypothetical protein